MCSFRRRQRDELAPSFDRLVDAHQQRRRNVEAERLGSLEIEHELEPGRLYDRKIPTVRATIT
jgi:hypothetical protein